MAEIPPYEPHDRPIAPPVAPIARPVSPPPSSWPNVLGVIGIVFGGLAILGGISGALSPLYNEGLQSLMPAEQAAVKEAMEATRQLAPYTVVSSLFTIVVATLLLAGGIGLLRRRAGAVGRLKLWAVLKILLVVVTSYVGVWTQREVLKLMQEQTGGGSMPGMEMFLTAGIVVGVILGVLWGWALPVFVLIWFSRKKIRDEVATWA